MKTRRTARSSTSVLPDDRIARDSPHEQEHEILVSLSAQSLNDDVVNKSTTVTHSFCVVSGARPLWVMSPDVGADVTVVVCGGCGVCPGACTRN